MDSLRKELEDEINISRINKQVLYSQLLKILDQINTEPSVPEPPIPEPSVPEPPTPDPPIPEPSVPEPPVPEPSLSDGTEVKPKKITKKKKN